ncbi:alpha/beta fold hydrolase [Cupriavidus sp. AU9028]|uniref:alpha/beta fold hydrolase n=1 Tax=Cupriavidus sp. AU9028 TaxID=2871157 RepID=UPI001C9403F2|nr:alpha/beta fold hydrolase [Cupriavidus sp. AU9028]MBY4896038.1 alpha/beta hydrolase [Cupriavidus sp. AU9028]
MTWLLLRGLTREARHWGSLPEALQEAGVASAASPVACLDLPGSGQSRAHRSPVTVEAMVEALRRDARAAGLVAPLNLLAMSLGGMVATAWAQRYPAEVHRLVLINTSMRPFGWPHQRLRPAAWPLLLRLLLAWDDAERCELAIHRLTCANDSALQRDLLDWVQIRRNAPVRRSDALRQLYAAARFHAGTAAPSCPTLLLASAGDRLVQPRCSARISSAWNYPLRMHPQAGHDLPHDDPRWVAEQVADWLLQRAQTETAASAGAATSLVTVPRPNLSRQ